MNRALGFILTLSLFCVGCSSAVYQRNQYIEPYFTGDLCTAETEITKTIEQELPEERYEKSNDSVWLLLDRATIRFAEGDICNAIHDYRLAIDAMDLYNQNCIGEVVGQTLLQDDVGAYAGFDYEQVLARIYLAMALIYQEDIGNAHAILRQAEELQQKKKEEYRECPATRDISLTQNALGKYLFAVLLEKRGDLSNARILYQQASDLTHGTLGCKELTALNNPCNDNATILFVCHNGNAPIKISVNTDISVLSTVALEMIMQRPYDPIAISSITGLPTPALTYWIASTPFPTIACVDGTSQILSLGYDVGGAVKEELAQKMPIIVARSTARYLMRRAAIEAAKRQDCQLGSFVDMGMLIANLCTSADTRSWTTLPDRIDITRYDVEPGTHNVQVLVVSLAQQLVDQYQLELKAQDLCIIHIFNIHPFVTKVKIPERFRSLGDIK